MRKRNPTLAALAAWVATACACLCTGRLAAQTTFARTNDPSAAIEVERSDEELTVIRITQRPSRAGYAAVSEGVVLRDERTGVAYRPVSRRRATRADTVCTELAFAASDLALGQGPAHATLVDAHAPGRGLFVAGIGIDR